MPSYPLPLFQSYTQGTIRGQHKIIQLRELPCPSVRPLVTKKSCIMVTCIRVKDHGYMLHLYLHHTHMQGSYIVPSWIHASCKYSLGSRIIDMCIIHTCIWVKDQGIALFVCLSNFPVKCSVKCC